MEKIDLDKRLFFRNCKFKSSEEAETFLAQQLKNYGYVKEGYKEAILKREKNYPTGLPSSSPAIAIPHADAELVNKTTIAVATLVEPVTFKDMGATDKDLPVRIIIMLVLSEPHSQVQMLQKIVSIVQDESLRKQICNTKDDKELIDLIKSKLN